jgi:hypothetical protein
MLWCNVGYQRETLTEFLEWSCTIITLYQGVGGRQEDTLSIV